MQIVGPTKATLPGMMAWATKRKATEEFQLLAPIYWKLAPFHGVRPEVAYAQAAKETGFGKFGGVVTAQFHNPCGMKITKGGSDTDPNAHQRFPTWEVGIQAHLDHLALYAGAYGYPRFDTFDPRHFAFLHGDAPTVEELGGTWAPAKSYGEQVKVLVREIMEGVK